jgi:hypothetical protein
MVSRDSRHHSLPCAPLIFKAPYLICQRLFAIRTADSDPQPLLLIARLNQSRLVSSDPLRVYLNVQSEELSVAPLPFQNTEPRSVPLARCKKVDGLVLFSGPATIGLAGSTVFNESHWVSVNTRI